MEKGRTEGEARILQRLLVARFGPLSKETISTIEGANTVQLEAWTDRFLAAKALADVFAVPAD